MSAGHDTCGALDVGPVGGVPEFEPHAVNSSATAASGRVFRLVSIERFYLNCIDS
jgi:hypothetical protein